MFSLQQSPEVKKNNELNLDKRLWNDPTIIVENKPTFLGGIMHGSGNKPPGVVPDKMMYMMHDLQRIKGGPIATWSLSHYSGSSKVYGPVGVVDHGNRE